MYIYFIFYIKKIIFIYYFIILNIIYNQTYQQSKENKALRHDIHFWLGKYTTKVFLIQILILI